MIHGAVLRSASASWRPATVATRKASWIAVTVRDSSASERSAGLGSETAPAPSAPLGCAVSITEDRQDSSSSLSARPPGHTAGRPTNRTTPSVR